MNVVNFSLDPKILDPESVAAIRVRAYGTITESYSVIVPTPATVTVKLTDSAIVYGIGGANKLVQLWNIYRKLIELIRSGKCDVITSSDMYYLGLVGLSVARKYRLGLEVQVLGIEKLNYLRKKIAMYVLQHASVVRALSERIRGRILKEFNVYEKKVHVVPIYVDVKKLGLNVHSLSEEEVREFERLSQTFREQYSDCFNFVTVSRLVPIKRIELQFRALKKLVSEYSNARLHIVGDGPLEGGLKKEAENLGLNEHVIFHGRKTGLALGVFYLESDCFLLTSDYEGWGMVIVEAATAGLPIIMTDVGCAGEFIKDDESGLIVPVNNEEALESAMKKVLSDAQLRESLSLGTKKAVDSLQSFDEILKLYKENWELAFNHPL